MTDEKISDNRRLFAFNTGMELDGQDFSNQDVHDNQFVYAGGELPKLFQTNFFNNKINFVGAALNTMAMFQFLISSVPMEDREKSLRDWGFIKPDEKLTLTTKQESTDGK